MTTGKTWDNSCESDSNEDKNPSKLTSDKHREAEEDFYWENGFLVFTSAFLQKRGWCCGNGCRHCPYVPKHNKGNRNLG